MKIKKIIYLLSMAALLVIGTATAQALLGDTSANQQKSDKKWEDQKKMDSLNYSKDKSDAKAKDAKDAATESRKAVNTEKKAQKAREKADEQNKKATNSNEKSDSNY